jgi:hypothetical protein
MMNLLSPMSDKPLGNPMQPQPAAGSMAGNPHEQLIAGMTAQHATARAKLDKIDETAAKQRAVREQLDHLMTLGDLVDERDLVRSASKIVAAGIEPMAVASLLADAPSGGEALQSWIAGQEQQFRQREAQLGAIQGMARHETGLAALRLLAAQRFGSLATPAEATPGQSNPLMNQQPTLSPPPLGVDNSAPQLAPDTAPGGNELLSEAPQ